MSPDYRVRPMGEFDVSAVMELERAMFPDDAWSEEMLRAELAQPTRYYIVACRQDDGGHPERGGGIVAYAGLRVEPPRGDVQTIAVERAWWGRGIASAMLTELLGRAYARGANEVSLEVRSDNPRARDLYRRFEFAEVGVRRGYYRGGADAIVMRCHSPAAASVRTRGGEPGEALEFGEPVDGAGQDEETA